MVGGVEQTNDVHKVGLNYEFINTLIYWHIVNLPTILEVHPERDNEDTHYLSYTAAQCTYSYIMYVFPPPDTVQKGCGMKVEEARYSPSSSRSSSLKTIHPYKQYEKGFFII